MARRMTQVFHGWDQRDVTVTLPAGHERAGEHQGLLRAWAFDDETGEWWGMRTTTPASGCSTSNGSARTTYARPVTSPTTTAS